MSDDDDGDDDEEQEEGEVSNEVEGASSESEKVDDTAKVPPAPVTIVNSRRNDPDDADAITRAHMLLV
jgi:hypothetical protein